MTEDEAQKLIKPKTAGGDPRYQMRDLMAADGHFKPLTPEQANAIYDPAKVLKFRPATPAEANLLYCDIHSKAIWR